MDWAEVDWSVVRQELEALLALAKQRKIWITIGSAHPLTPPHRPHNSLYIVSDEGELVDRYDKRYCSFTETTQFYTPGRHAVTFEVDGYRFGCLICVELNFPELLMDYDAKGVDCVLLSAYPIDKVFLLKARAHAALHNFWVSLSVPTECVDLMRSGLIGPEGDLLCEVETDVGLVFHDLDRLAPEWDIAFRKARPWRAVAGTGEFYRPYLIDDPRSDDKTGL
jgi:predicted amidohydrolase